MKRKDPRSAEHIALVSIETAHCGGRTWSRKTIYLHSQGAKRWRKSLESLVPFEDMLPMT
jgi:hypothetical protein